MEVYAKDEKKIIKHSIKQFMYLAKKKKYLHSFISPCHKKAERDKHFEIAYGLLLTLPSSNSCWNLWVL